MKIAHRWCCVRKLEENAIAELATSDGIQPFEVGKRDDRLERVFVDVRAVAEQQNLKLGTATLQFFDRVHEKTFADIEVNQQMALVRNVRNRCVREQIALAQAEFDDSRAVTSQILDGHVGDALARTEHHCLQTGAHTNERFHALIGN